MDARQSPKKAQAVFQQKAMRLRGTTSHAMLRIMECNFLSKLRFQLDHLKVAVKIGRHFENPWLIILLRLGVIKSPYFLYRIRKDT